MSTNGFSFANPTYTADNFFTYSAGDIEADAKMKELQSSEPIPAPRVQPPLMDLSAVLPASALTAIKAAGRIVFHAAGDSGGVVKAEPQLAVADAMAADLANKTYATDLPAFFYHLGDVVYYFGQQQYYPEQFYDPYRNSLLSGKRPKSRRQVFPLLRVVPDLSLPRFELQAAQMPSLAPPATMMGE